MRTCAIKTGATPATETERGNEMKLYELADNYNALKSLLDEDGATEEAVKGQLQIIEENFNAKAENIGKVILSLDSDTVALAEEIKRLSARKQATERKADWLKSYLLTEMLNTKTDKIKGQLLTVSVRNNPPSVNIVNPDLIPEAYRRIIPETWQPDKTAILLAVKNMGEIVPGCEIITDKKSLSVK
jgi:hypothetical protein